MTRTFLILLVCLAHLATARAQWTQVERFVKDGRPASALAEARRLLDGAATPGERMQALLCVGRMQQELTPDSLFATAAALMQWHRTSATCAERAVTAVTLARLLEVNQWRSQYRAKASGYRPADMRLWSRDDYRFVADSLRAVAWRQPFDSLHAVKAGAWTPFVEMATAGRDVLASQWWGDDLLHLVLADAPDSVWTRAKAFYATVGCHEPEIEGYIRRCRDSIDVCREGIGRFTGDKRVAVLRNELMRIECPQFGFYAQTAYYPGHEYKFLVEARNVSRYTIQAYSLASEPKRWDVSTVRAQGKAVGRLVEGQVGSDAPVFMRYTTPLQPGLYALIVTPVPTREVKKTEPVVVQMRVSRNLLLYFGASDGGTRFAVVDAMSGAPVSGVTVRVEHSREQTWTGKTDASGRTPVWKASRRVSNARASIVGDAQQPDYIGTRGAYTATEQVRQVHNLYTDRAIYRPGQTVQVGVVAYEAGAKTAQVMAGRQLPVSLRTAKGELQATDTLTTDTLGTAATLFTLPADAAPGVWHVLTQHGHMAFRVEEYKRPTFGIEMEQVDTPLVVRLAARSFAGVPVRGARVTGRYAISQPWWWRSRLRHTSRIVGVEPGDTQIDTLTTDAQGYALIRLSQPKVETTFASLTLTVDVMSPSGETHSETLRLPLRRDELAIQADVPRQVERSHIVPWDVRLVDATERAVQGDITATVTACEPPHTAALSQVPLGDLPARLATLPTARYRVTFAHGGVRSESRDFTLFSVTDTFTPDTAHFYATADTLPCRMHIGTCLDSVTLFVNVTDGAEMLWDKQITLSRSATTLDLPLATHSDGLTVSFAFTKGETVNTWTNTFTNPQPDRHLRWHWDTFRDRTVPGSRERWSGTLLRPDGTPATAAVMLTLYDASLDALARHDWQLDFRPRLSCGYGEWLHTWREMAWMRHASFTLPLLREPELKYHHFSSKYLDGAVMRGDRIMYKAAPLMSAATGASVRREMAAGKQSAVTDAVEEMAVANDADDFADDDLADGGDVDIDEAALRSDFSEQAVFAPCLRTDADGRFTLDFTLPESVTTWQLLGTAHTADMMTATTRRQCVAQKEVMVQLSVPRFMRLGDEGTVTAIVSTLVPATGRGRLVVSVDGVTVAEFSLNGDTVIAVPVKATATGDMTVRAIVATDSHSDGEQRSIPVIDSRTWTVETIDLATTTAATFAVPPMPKSDERHVTLTMTPAPVWTAVSALPAMMQPDADDAISLANAYFATTLTHHLAVTVPQVQERRHFPLDSLRAAADGWYKSLEALQGEDGSFAWFPCGHSSTFITTEVAVELARLVQLTGRQSPLLKRAMDYLSRQTDERIAWMKKHDNTTVDAMSFYYLYASALMGVKVRQAGFLLPIMARELTAYDLNMRAIAAVVMHHYNKDSEARRFLTSLDEHIVTAAGRGAYFDYAGGSFTSIDRKLQTLTTAIEAKTLLGDTLHLAGLHHNLLQQRRTQGWDNKLFATAAVAAVLGQSPTALTPGSPSPSPSRGEGSVMLSVDNTQHTILTDTTLVLTTVPHHIQITPLPTGGDGGGAWAALFVRTLRADAGIVATHTGIEVRREVATEACVGDRLTVRYIITADRDYEWVRLTAAHAACLEPVEQLSGYRCQGGLCYYHSPRDDREDFFFERLPRGTYIIESQAFADRAGTYASGITAIECLYAPEFTGHTANTVTVVR